MAPRTFRLAFPHVNLCGAGPSVRVLRDGEQGEPRTFLPEVRLEPSGAMTWAEKARERSSELPTGWQTSPPPTHRCPVHRGGLLAAPWLGERGPPLTGGEPALEGIPLGSDSWSVEWRSLWCLLASRTNT